MTKKEIKDIDIKNKKFEVNHKHIVFYDKALLILEFILNEFSKELKKSDIEFLDMPKNTVSTLDFIISSIGKIQKGQRLALGLDTEQFEDTLPAINIIEGLNEQKV